MKHIFQNKDVYPLAWTQVKLWMQKFLQSLPQWVMSNIQRPDLLALSLSPLHGCLAWRCCRVAEVKTIQMSFKIFSSEGLRGKPRVWGKLKTETSQSCCQNWAFGPISSSETGRKSSCAKWTAPSSVWGAVYGRAMYERGTAAALLTCSRSVAWLILRPLMKVSRSLE